MNKLSLIIEALLFSSSRPLSEKEIISAFEGSNLPELNEVRDALKNIEAKYLENSVELVKVASGYRLRIKQEYSSWVSKLWEAKPQKYPRALLETLALIAYKQPIKQSTIIGGFNIYLVWTNNSDFNENFGFFSQRELIQFYQDSNWKIEESYTVKEEYNQATYLIAKRIK